jgi:putative ABC transport system permease protein
MAKAGEGIAGYGFLERFGVSVGDRVEVLVGTTPVTVDIVGWYRDTEDNGEVLRYRLEALTAAEPGTVPDNYAVTTGDGADPSAVAAALAERLGPTAQIEILDTGAGDLSPLLVVLRLVAGVLLLMAGVNLLTTLVTANREAAGRVGVQLAIGFTPRQLTTQGAAAGAALGVVASVVGVPVGLWVFRRLSDVVSQSVGVGPGWMPAPHFSIVAVLVVAAVGVAAGLGALAVARVARRPASDLLRQE